jgi:hypothetical protein
METGAEFGAEMGAGFGANTGGKRQAMNGFWVIATQCQAPGGLVWDRVYSVRELVWDSVRISVSDSMWDSVHISVWDPVCISVWDSMWRPVLISIQNAVQETAEESEQTTTMHEKRSKP